MPEKWEYHQRVFVRRNFQSPSAGVPISCGHVSVWMAVKTCSAAGFEINVSEPLRIQDVDFSKAVDRGLTHSSIPAGRDCCSKVSYTKGCPPQTMKNIGNAGERAKHMPGLVLGLYEAAGSERKNVRGSNDEGTTQPPLVRRSHLLGRRVRWPADHGSIVILMLCPGPSVASK
ncbi:hypothetical protein BJV74DRAFT_263091 [Russula compacta]|nr:hypothetical protein BJV74DRAFT_263091 [Russula compacta]